MSLVKLFAKQGETYNLFYRVDEGVALRHLEVVRDLLSDIDPRAEEKRVYLDKACARSMIFVLEKVADYGDRTDIRIQPSQPLSTAISIHQAIQALGVSPKQPRVERHIVWYLTNRDLSAEDISNVQKEFGHLGRASRSWAAMVDRLARGLFEGRHTEDQKRAITREVEKYPELRAAISEKVDFLMAEKEFNEKDERERMATGRTYQRKYYSPMPLKVHATPRQSGEDDERVKAKTLNGLNRKFGKMKVTKPRVESTEPWKDLEVIARDCKEGTAITRFFARIPASKGIMSVRVEVVVDQDKADRDQLGEQINEWGEGVEEVFSELYDS